MKRERDIGVERKQRADASSEQQPDPEHARRDRLEHGLGRARRRARRRPLTADSNPICAPADPGEGRHVLRGLPFEQGQRAHAQKAERGQAVGTLDTCRRVAAEAEKRAEMPASLAVVEAEPSTHAGAKTRAEVRAAGE